LLGFRAPSEPIKLTDPDLLWTGWTLHLVREAAEMDMRIKRMTERQQERASVDSPLDFGLIQSRLSRSLRMSVAMAERIRTNYLLRRGEREASGEQQRRRQKREQMHLCWVRLARTQPTNASPACPAFHTPFPLEGGSKGARPRIRSLKDDAFPFHEKDPCLWIPQSRCFS
jgi:hypothetical protein